MVELTYIEEMRAIAKMIEDAVKEKGYICHVGDVEYSSSVGYDVFGVYVCERDKYIAEFGNEER
jgi:hypothetical protein